MNNRNMAPNLVQLELRRPLSSSIFFKPAITGQASVLYMSVVSGCSVSDASGNEDLNITPTVTHQKDTVPPYLLALLFDNI